MKLQTMSLTVNRKGYVKDEDAFVQYLEDAQRIIVNYVSQMKTELETAGFELDITNDREIA